MLLCLHSKKRNVAINNYNVNTRSQTKINMLLRSHHKLIKLVVNHPMRILAELFIQFAPSLDHFK